MLGAQAWSGIMAGNVDFLAALERDLSKLEALGLLFGEMASRRLGSRAYASTSRQ